MAEVEDCLDWAVADSEQEVHRLDEAALPLRIALQWRPASSVRNSLAAATSKVAEVAVGSFLRRCLQAE